MESGTKHLSKDLNDCCFGGQGDITKDRSIASLMLTAQFGTKKPNCQSGISLNSIRQLIQRWGWGGGGVYESL